MIYVIDPYRGRTPQKGTMYVQDVLGFQGLKNKIDRQGICIFFIKKRLTARMSKSSCAGQNAKSNSEMPNNPKIKLIKIMACFFVKIPLISTVDPSASIFTDSSSISISKLPTP